MSERRGLRAPFFLAFALLATACAHVTPAQNPVVSLEGAHDLGATRVAFSPDGRMLASGGLRGEVKVWGLPGGLYRQGFSGHWKPVRGLAWPDAQTLVSASEDGWIRVWSLSDREATRSRDTGSPVKAMALDASGGRLVTAHGDGSVRVYALPGLAEQNRRHFGAGLLSVAVSPGGDRVAVSTEDGRVVLADPGLERSQELTPAGRRALELRFSPDGGHLAAGAWFKVLQWDLANGGLMVLDTEHLGAVISLDFTPDGRRLASIGRHTDSQVRLLDLESGQVLRRLSPHRLCGFAVRVSPDGRFLATASEDESVRLYDLSAPYLPTRDRNAAPGKPPWGRSQESAGLP